MLNNSLISKLLALQLPHEDYAVFGSAIMYFYGLKDLDHDLDVIARGSAWEKACSIKAPKIPESQKGLVVSPYGDDIEIFSDWGPGEWDINELIDTAEIIGGIRVVGFNEVIKWKRLMGREKDFEHIQMIEEYLKKKS